MVYFTYMIYFLKILFITEVNNTFVKNVKQKWEIKKRVNTATAVFNSI